MYISIYLKICNILSRKWPYNFAGNIYRNNLKNSVALVMGQLLFLFTKRLRM